MLQVVVFQILVFRLIIFLGLTAYELTDLCYYTFLDMVRYIKQASRRCAAHAAAARRHHLTIFRKTKMETQTGTRPI